MLNSCLKKKKNKTNSANSIKTFRSRALSVRTHKFIKIVRRPRHGGISPRQRNPNGTCSFDFHGDALVIPCQPKQYPYNAQRKQSFSSCMVCTMNLCAYFGIPTLKVCTVRDFMDQTKKNKLKSRLI